MTEPDPDIIPEPERRDEPEKEPKPGKRVASQVKGTLESVKEMGSTPIPEIKRNIHCLTIVGHIKAI